MKSIKVAMLTAASALLLASPAMAFHDGGVANCEGCHTMHNSLGGTQMNKTKYALTQGVSAQYVAAPYLLQGTQSETCLNCHESTPGSYHISTPVAGVAGAGANNLISQFILGGDFRWLTIAGSSTADKATHGHNINAPAYGYTGTGEVKTVAPGGVGTAYPTANLNCSSCHDPHGKYRRAADTAVFTIGGNAVIGSGSYDTSPVPAVNQAVGSYRLLAGNTYKPKSVGAGVTAFINDPPVAFAPSSYNISESGTLAGSMRVAYGSGMSEWCANCHGKMHTTAAYASSQTSLEGVNVHPAGSAIGATIMANYNAYVKTGDNTGVVASAWNSLVPFETGATTTFAALKALAGPGAGGLGDQAGVDANSQVMCLSCHRAHASGFNSMLRYPATSTFVTEDGAYAVDSRGNGATKNALDFQTALNNRPAASFGDFQRALCNKCHAKD